MSEIIGSIIVAYNPDEAEFKSVIEASLKQVDFLVVVNNSKVTLDFPSSHQNSGINRHLSVIENKDNLGVATALNQGVRVLMQKGCTHILFLDQDSLIPNGMVSRLHSEFNRLLQNKVKVAAIGPSFFDASLQKASPFIRFKKVGYDFIHAHEASALTSVHLLITSGTFTSVDVVNDVGFMDDGLFIDCVDHEWCLRAISKGYSLFADSKVEMKHAIGDAPIVFRNEKYHNHSPLRHYYIARNSVHLLKRNYIPLSWRLTMMITAIKLFVFYSMISKKRFINFKLMLKGFFHGLLGKYGRFDLI